MSVLAPLCPVSASDDAFAFYLVKDKDYARAAGEFKRLAFYADDDSLRLTYLLWTARTERWAGNSRFAGKYINHTVSHSTDFKFQHDRALLEKRFLLMEPDRWDFFGAGQLRPETDSIAVLYSNLLDAAQLVYARDWASLDKKLKDFPGNTIPPRLEAHFESIRDYYPQQKFKSPALAASMSFFIPGSGQYYCDHPVDAVQSFMFSSFFLSASIIAWNHDDRVHGRPEGLFAVSAIVSGLVHSANIYGAWKTALYRNMRLVQDPYEKLYKKIDEEYRLKITP